MLVNILILVIAAIFSAHVLCSACRKYLGYNPQAPSLWKRFKAWWPGFVKRNIVDDDPYQDESHARTRYPDDYIDWSKVPEGLDWATAALGSVCLWEHKPYASEEYQMFNSSTAVLTIATLDAIIGPLPPWRDSLRHRPGK